MQTNPKCNSSLYREIVESLTRCYIHTKNYEKALELSRILLLKTNPANVEQMANCWSLLAQAYGGVEDFNRSVAALVSLVELHPQLPEIWQEMAVGFDSLGNAKMALYCRVREQRLLQSVQKTVSGIALTTNLKKQSDVEMSREDATLIIELVDEELFHRGKAVEEKDKLISENTLSPAPNNHPPSWINDAEKAEAVVSDFTKNCLKEKC